GHSLGIREALDRMQASVVAHPYAKAAVEIALWDLLGKATRQPLRVLLGGNADPDVKIPIKYVIGIGDEDHIAAEIEFGREQGFTHFKTKVGADLDDDLVRVAAIAHRLTSGETIGVDANAG